MKILIDLGHPAHLHLFKNAIWIWEKKEHEVKIIAKDKDVLLKLLDNYNFQYEISGKDIETIPGKALGMLKKDMKLLNVAKKFKPDLLLSTGSPYAAHISGIIKKPHIAFEDSENAILVLKTYMPFTDVVCTPSCFLLDLGPKQVRYNGYHELAYLHPNYFKPDPSIFEDLGLTRKDKFIIFRLISWGASHDIYSKGLSKKYLLNIINEFEKFGYVFITSEGRINKNLKKYEITFPPEKIHSALYYANLYFGEGGTLAVEAALLGTPSIHIEAYKIKTGEIVDVTKIHGNFNELVNRYKILFTFVDEKQALRKALKILQNKNAKRELKQRIRKLLSDKIDVTAFIVDLIEQYLEN